MQKEQMNEYIGTERIRATPMTRGDYCKLRGWTIPSDENPEDKGYLVEYTDGIMAGNVEGFDGYVSWSPKEQFENAYNCTGDGMTFGHAIEMMKLGKCVARKGWNGKNMYIWLYEGEVCDADWLGGVPFVKEIALQNEDKKAEYLPCIHMRTADSKVLTGWLASQTDMLATDWVLVG